MNTPVTRAELLTSSGMPGEGFWEQYAGLWADSLDRSPFEAPNLLRYFAGLAGEQVQCFQYVKDGQLLAAVLLKLRRKNLSFLSDMKTDANFFVFSRKSAPDDWKNFFRLFLQTVEKRGWAITLNHQPHWAVYMGALEEALKESGMFWRSFPYSVCPVVEKESPEALYKEINGYRELRYRVNRLKGQENAVFEALTDGADLEHWVEEFCASHVLRWADTPTPSGYQTPASRKFLLGCLQAWNADGLLVRFAVVVGGHRIGFVVGLREGNSLIHHSTTFHPDFKKQSPGKALILFMAEWMSKNGYAILDFGDGNESYKYTVANKEHQVNRIFASGKYNLRYIAKARFIQTVKETSRIYDLYQKRLKPALRNLKRRLANISMPVFL